MNERVAVETAAVMPKTDDRVGVRAAADLANLCGTVHPTLSKIAACHKSTLAALTA